MYRILTCLTTEHDWRLVVVAGVICLLASLVAVNLYHRARATAGNVRLLWIITAGAATGSGIWATHFIAMLAYDPGVGIAFHTALTVLSLLAAAMVTSIGLGIAAMFPGRLSDAIGGAIVGGGVACMHYTGMMAVELPGQVRWDPLLVTASIAIGMLLAMFYVVDRLNFNRAPRSVRQQETAHEEWRFDGLGNILFLAIILIAVFINKPPFLREAQGDAGPEAQGLLQHDEAGPDPKGRRLDEAPHRQPRPAGLPAVEPADPQASD